MKTSTYNIDNLKDSEIEEKVTRVKIFLINEKNEILFANSYGGIQLIGGHVEKQENELTALVREIKEEAGITINPKKISKPFFKIKNYTKNYNNTNKNRLSEIVYYFSKTIEIPNEKETNLTDAEKEGKFKAEYIPIEKVESRLKKCLKSDDERIIKIAEETLEAFSELKNLI